MNLQVTEKTTPLSCGLVTVLLWFWLGYVGCLNAAPTLTGCSPFVLARGKTTTVKLSGKDLKATSLHFSVAGITAKPSKSNTFEVAVESGCPLVDCDVWAMGGEATVSGPIRIRIVEKTNVFVEAEPNDEVNAAQQVTLPCYVAAGFQKSAERDRFRFNGKAGQFVSVTASAKDLESKAVPVISLQSADGMELGFGSQGSDRTILACRLPVDGQYIVTVHEAAYRANQPAHYCLQLAHPAIVVGNRPPVVPHSLNQRTKLRMRIFGFGLGTKSQQQGQLAGSLTTQNSLELTKAIIGPGLWEVHSARYRMASSIRREPAMATSQQHRLGLVTVSRLPILDAAEVGGTKAKPVPLKLPIHVCRAIDRPAKTDWYSFEARKGESIAIDAWGERLGRRMDLEFYIFDSKGKQVAKGDDTSTPKQLVGMLDVGSMDPSLVWTPTKTASYSLAIRDLYGSSLFGNDRFYELILGRADTQQKVFALPNVAVGQGPSIKQGGSLEIPVGVWRVGESRQNISVSLADGANGITAAPVVLKAGVTKAKLVLKADSKTEPGLVVVRLAAGIATKSDKMRVEDVSALVPSALGSHRVVDEMVLMVTK